MTREPPARCLAITVSRVRMASSTVRPTVTDRESAVPARPGASAAVLVAGSWQRLRHRHRTLSAPPTLLPAEQSSRSYPDIPPAYAARVTSCSGCGQCPGQASCSACTAAPSGVAWLMCRRKAGITGSGRTDAGEEHEREEQQCCRWPERPRALGATAAISRPRRSAPPAASSAATMKPASCRGSEHPDSRAGPRPGAATTARRPGQVASELGAEQPRPAPPGWSAAGAARPRPGSWPARSAGRCSAMMASVNAIRIGHVGVEQAVPSQVTGGLAEVRDAARR